MGENILPRLGRFLGFYMGPFSALKGDIRIWGCIACFPPPRPRPSWLACGEWIWARPTERAATAFRRLSADDKASFATIKAALKARFEPECRKELYKAESQARKKTQTENWATYGVASFPGAEDLGLRGRRECTLFAAYA